MDISIVIVTYNEEKNIRQCLDSVLSQEYSSGQWEVLIVDGKSCDSTVGIVEDEIEFRQKILPIPVRLITNPKRQISCGRNLGIKNAKYPFIAFTDADCIVPADWLNKLSTEYKELSISDMKIAGVGGGNVPPRDLSKFYKTLEIYLNSFLGSFNSPQGRNFSSIRKVNSLSCTNSLYKREVLEKIESFDEKLGNISEDRDLNIRLKQQGYNIYFIPDIAVIHRLRSNLLSWLCNVALYGRGRAIVSFKHKAFLNLFFILPLCFILSMMLIGFGTLKPIFFLPLLYFPIIISYILIILFKNNSIALFPGTLLLFILTHFVYSWNLLIKSLKICAKK